MKLYEYEEKHYEMVRKSAPECMVLLKRNGDFPLNNACKVALYGNGIRHTVRGGTGSGEVNSHFTVTVEEGLERAGFQITTKAWLNAYDEIKEQSHKKFVEGIKIKAKQTGVPAVFLGMGAVMPEPEYDIPLDDKEDTAIYVLARISGEGSDRNPVEGDFKLTKTEIRNILNLRKTHKKFLLALNVGGVVDLTPVMAVENILNISQLGACMGDAFADVILGKSYPSGKLTTTWAAFEDYCKVGQFGNENDTEYNEGIYVGYRYFNTVGKKPLFPFGYGLGYTTFSINNTTTKLNGSSIEINVTVTNTGKRPGKEILQAYVSVPSGILDQPYQALAAFSKTKELLPGETQELKLVFGLEQLASFDENRACTILEAGDYLVRLGNSSNAEICAVVNLDSVVIVQKLSNSGGKPDFKDWKPENVATQKALPEAPVLYLHSTDFKAKIIVAQAVDEKFRNTVKGLSDSDLAYLCVGAFKEARSKSVIGNAAFSVAGAAGETTSKVEGIKNIVMSDGPAGLRLTKHYGKDEDGIYVLENAVPDAFIDFIDEDALKMMGFDTADNTEKKERNGQVYDQYCTAIPIGTALAQSWNISLVEACGSMVAEEMLKFGVHLWLAPALNIHRNVLCGRNYEYYSEDPLVSGKMAAAMTRGVQSHKGCGVTIKHYACNNQETNRFRSNSVVNQRTLRDIYLKGFEVCISECQPVALMTSYNLLNGIHTSERKDIIDTILRKEWGYNGLVISDWVTPVPLLKKKYEFANAEKSIKAGNDIMMPGGQNDFEGIMSALNGTNRNVTLSREEIEECAERVIAATQKLIIC